MQVPETPIPVEELGLMKRLQTYGDGNATWHSDGTQLGPNEKRFCRELYINIRQFVSQVLAPLLDRITAREMETFTMHDRTHGQKVAHLMWHILAPSTRERLTPPEIGMMVLSAYFHDVGMALSPEERKARLQPGSGLWQKIESQEATNDQLERRRLIVGNAAVPDSVRMRARLELDQAEEILLCNDTRERHATEQRYGETLENLRKFHEQDPVRIVSPDKCLSFDGFSFRKQLIDICVSHNEDADALIRRDSENPERPRFPRQFPCGCCAADLHIIAAVLRVADILDFDRERTPPVLFYYLLPGTYLHDESRAVLEWGKHMAISSWQIGEDAIIFHGRCTDHIIHHTIVQFCSLIQEEITATRETFAAVGGGPWPLLLPSSVRADIHEDGYHYVPYQFKLDDKRIYELLMGGAIYDNPLVGVRELVQNAVDACRLRDNLTRVDQPYVQLGLTGRISVCYEEPSTELSLPVLIVSDTGTGMDEFILQRYFLQVGQSYYRSSEFNRDRMELRRANLDFAPVSEFGIGFLACFLLADRLTVGTAMWEPRRGDTRKRTLVIDGPTRLIRMDESPNQGRERFVGTRVTLYLCRGGKEAPEGGPPTWDEIQRYLRDVCQDLPYRLELEHRVGDEITSSWIDPTPMSPRLPPHLESAALRICVTEKEFGLDGEIVVLHPERAQAAEKEFFETASATLAEPDNAESISDSALIRGGFRVGSVPGLPTCYRIRQASAAKLRLAWENQRDRRYPVPNLARNAPSDQQGVLQQVLRAWVSFCLDHLDELPEGQLRRLGLPYLGRSAWLERYDAFTLYRLARQAWEVDEEKLQAWESGSGDPLRLGIFHDDLQWRVMDLILPRVCSLQMGPECRFYVTPPITGWKTILQGWRSYVTAPISWGPFVEYVGGIRELLAYEYPRNRQLNARFQEDLRQFKGEELSRLFRILCKLVSAARSQRAAELSASDVQLVKRAVVFVGDAWIGSIDGSWRLDSFKI
jgi:hypothetical protein